MGTIRTEVRNNHLKKYPEEEILLKPFLSGFFVTWGARRHAFNTEISVYFLNPDEYMKETYGFQHNVLLVYSNYQRMEDRTLQSVEAFFSEFPAKGRVETLNWILVSESEEVHDYVSEYFTNTQESKIIIAFKASDLRQFSSDNYFVRNTLNKQFFTRDLFDYKLPLIKDTYFFGRELQVMNYFDAIRLSENRGIFGLRKTGKTSILYKLRRMVSEQNIGNVFYYDCKKGHLRRRRWFELLEFIIRDIASVLKIPLTKSQFDELNISYTFEKLLEGLSEEKRIVLIFDEIEWIAFNAIRDKHWKDDFLDFWQTIWALQSEHRKLCVIIAGLNPSVIETDTIDGMQNPLFGIIPFHNHYLRGFSKDDMNDMVKKLGNKMGILFSQDGIDYLFKRYGGHPLLTRQACSVLHNTLRATDAQRPVRLNADDLRADEIARDEELVFYCRHVVSEIQTFYPLEYELLENLASGSIVEFMDNVKNNDQIKHLISYGLVEFNADGIPHISIPVVGRYIGMELARREGRKTIHRIVPISDRALWLHRRMATIIKDMRLLEKLIRQNNLPFLFGVNSFPEAERLLRVQICNDEDQFDNFINVSSRCFVEPIKNYGSSLGDGNYFWNVIKDTYPGLYHSLNRINVYRNDHMHIKLNPATSNALLNYLNHDLEHQRPSEVEDLYFMLQQCVLDGLLIGIQIEINRLD